MDGTLSMLLSEVDKLFKHKSTKHRLSTYDYTLGRFPSGWQFSVVNSWYRWNDASHQHQFGVYEKPEQAVAAFLDYVHRNKINVAKLMEAPPLMRG